MTRLQALPTDRALRTSVLWEGREGPRLGMGKAREASSECQQGVPRGSGGPLSTPGPLLGSSTSSRPPQIVINPARRKMLQKLALYEDGVLDSLQLLSSSSLPGTLQEQ